MDARHARTYVTPSFRQPAIRRRCDPALSSARHAPPMIVGSAVVIAVLVVRLVPPGRRGARSIDPAPWSQAGIVRVQANRKTIRAPRGRHRRARNRWCTRATEGARRRRPDHLQRRIEARAAAQYVMQASSTTDLEAQKPSGSAPRSSIGSPTVQSLPEILHEPQWPIRGWPSMIRDQPGPVPGHPRRLHQLCPESRTRCSPRRWISCRARSKAMQIQVKSVDEQIKLDPGRDGRRTRPSTSRATAPKSRLITPIQRSIADLAGRRGSLESDIARLHQQQGETRMQVAANRDTRESRAAESLRQIPQSKIADTLPRLACHGGTFEQHGRCARRSTAATCFGHHPVHRGRCHRGR